MDASALLQTGSGTQSLHLSTHSDLINLMASGLRPIRAELQFQDPTSDWKAQLLEMQVSIRAENKADGK